DRVRAATAVLPPLTGLIPLRNERGRDLLVGQPPAVGRINAGERAGHRQRLRKAALPPAPPASGGRLLGSAGAGRREDNATTVWSPPADAVRARMIGQSLGVAARSRRDV